MSAVYRARPSGDWVAYVGPFPFPWGSAGARRVLGIAQSIARGGRRVVVANHLDSPPHPLRIEGHDDIWVTGTGEGPRAGDGAATKVAQMTVGWGRRTVAWLDGQPSLPSHVIVYGGLYAYAARIQAWARRRGVAVVQDVVEWYDPAQLAGGRLAPLWYSAQAAMRHAYPRADGVLAISTYLADYFETRDVPTLLVPPTADLATVAWSPLGSNAGARFVYAGTPGPKDLLAPAVDAIVTLRREGTSASLDILGPTPATVARLTNRTRQPAGIRVFPAFAQQQLSGMLRRSDFAVLIRPQARFTVAGFPTKFVEAMAVGTPSVTNAVGDVARYARDGVTAVLASGTGTEAVTDAFRRAAALDVAARRALRLHARDTAESAFAVDRYTASITRFLTEVGQG